MENSGHAPPVLKPRMCKSSLPMPQERWWRIWEILVIAPVQCSVHLGRLCCISRSLHHHALNVSVFSRVDVCDWAASGSNSLRMWTHQCANHAQGTISFLFLNCLRPRQRDGLPCDWPSVCFAQRYGHHKDVRVSLPEQCQATKWLVRQVATVSRVRATLCSPQRAARPSRHGFVAYGR